MKKLIAALVVITLVFVSATVMTFAEGTDNFIPSAEQDGDIDNPIEPNDTAPETGEGIPAVPMAIAGVLATAAAAAFISAGKGCNADDLQ